MRNKVIWLGWAVFGAALAVLPSCGVGIIGEGTEVLGEDEEGSPKADDGSPDTLEAAFIAVSPSTVSVQVGAKQVFEAQATDRNGNSFSATFAWESRNPGIGTMDSSGVFLGIAEGETTVVAKSGAVQGTATVMVTNAPPVLTVIAVSPAAAAVEVGATQEFQAQAEDQYGNPLPAEITWESGDKAVGTVDSSGVFLGVAEGATTVIAKSGTLQGTAAVEVNNAPSVVTSIEVSPASATVGVGATQGFQAQAKDQYGKSITATISWESSNTAVGTVDSSGMFLGIAGGETTVVAKGGTVKGTALVKVAAEAPDLVIAAVSDIHAGKSGEQTKVAALVKSMNPTRVIVAGDCTYDGTTSQFQTFNGWYGDLKDILLPAPGNHEYSTSGAPNYGVYFGARVGPKGKYWYSADLGNWHIVSLDSNAGMATGDSQYSWLDNDLKAATGKQVIAFWHHARYSSAEHGDNSKSAAVWKRLMAAKADIVINGHDHSYQRFTNMDGDGKANSSGPVELIGAASGYHLKDWSTSQPSEELYRENTDFGVLKLTLHADSYDWQFVSLSGKVLDQGSAACR